jgi:hypothetical protein
MGSTRSLDGDSTNAQRQDFGKLIGNRILAGQRRQYEGAVNEDKL